MKVTDRGKLYIQQAILDGLTEYNKSFSDTSMKVETIVQDMTNNIVKAVEEEC